MTHVLEGIERSSHAVILASAEGRVLHANTSAARIFDGVAGLDLSNPPPFEDPRGPLATLVAAWEEARSAEAPASKLHRARKSGAAAFLWFECITFGNNGGSGRMFVVTDLTALLSGAEPVRRMVAQLAHDLRSPLTSIAGATELLLSGRLGQLAMKQEKLVKIVDEGTVRMTTIINDAYEQGREGGASA
jgi:signal transduction histidine kinase